MTSRRRSRLRTFLIVATCALWVLGVVVVPALHVAFHDLLEPHHHGAGHTSDAHERSPAASEQAPQDEAPSRRTPTHGEGALAHGDLAVLGSPMSLPPVGPARLVRPCAQSGPVACGPTRVAIDRARARGPPV